MFNKKNASRICMTLCAALLVSGLTGCGDKGGSNQGGGSAPETITFPYTGEEIVFKGYGYEGLDQNPELLCQKAWKEHIGNIRIDWEFAAYSDYTEKSKIYLATNDIPDVMPVSDIMGTINEYSSTGMLLDFNKYAQYMPNLAEYRKTYSNLDYICKDDGARYGIMGVQPIDYSGEGWFANMDVLNAAGQKIPSTFSEMLDIMRAVKANDPSIVPFQTYWNISYTQRWVADSIGAQKNLVYYDTDAKEFKCSYREESAKRKELIQTLADMYKEGLINSEIQTMSFEQEQNAVASGKWAFTAMYHNSLEKEIFKVQPGEKLPFNIQAMTPPADADGVRRLGIAYQHDGVPGWGLVCSSKTKNPEYLAAYMDQVVSPFGRDIFNYGVEGVTYDIVDGDYVMKDGIDKAEYGVGTQYEVWMVGMGPKARTSEGYLLTKEDQELNLKNFTDGTVIADFEPAFAVFNADDGAEKANIENTLNTCIEENEAKFIYGIRDMSEWDAYVAELEKLASIDDLLKLYNSTQTIVRNPERIFVAK